MDEEHPSHTPTRYSFTYLCVGYRSGAGFLPYHVSKLPLICVNFNPLLWSRCRVAISRTHSVYTKKLCRIHKSIRIDYVHPSNTCLCHFWSTLSSFFLHNLYFQPSQYSTPVVSPNTRHRRNQSISYPTSTHLR
jgi:hypothetical protein